jgi:uncharacterized protein YggU (UPF0235/DUF167 family)
MEGTRLRLRVAPGSRRPGIAGRHGGGWKVRVAQPPEQGRANDAMLALLAETLALPRSALSIVSGHAGRDKIVAVEGIDSAEADRLLGERSSTT